MSGETSLRKFFVSVGMNSQRKTIRCSCGLQIWSIRLSRYEFLMEDDLLWLWSANMVDKIQAMSLSGIE